jgi:2-methylaconitate cis-trans-isomerase PrpF
VIVVAAQVERQGEALQARHASAYRTARRLFKGEVYYRTSLAR